MPPAATSKVDVVTWLINVCHGWEEECQDHWDNPSRYPFMREVLHESVHFWQAVGTPYFMRLSFSAFRDYHQVRLCAVRQGAGGSPVPIDLLELEPQRTYFLCYQRLTQPYGDERLSGTDLIEGLARYWDLHLSGTQTALDRLVDEGKVTHRDIEDAQQRLGPFFLPDGETYTDAAVDFLFEHEGRYNRAYAFARERIGREAFILFPVLGFYALSTGSQSVSTFQRWVIEYGETRPFRIPSGGYFLRLWDDCFQNAQQWILKELGGRIYSTLTVYRHSARRLMKWSIASGLALTSGVMTGHGFLDNYIRRYWWRMRERYPADSADDVELHFDPALCLPGIPAYRKQLVRHYHPPVILFSDGRTWLDQEYRDNSSPAAGGEVGNSEFAGPGSPVTDSGCGSAGGASAGEPPPPADGGKMKVLELSHFGGLLGAAMALTGEFPARTLKVRCPHTGCP